ncbi:25602_t:CDS:2, partial [Gigaspora margarita]
DYKVDHRDENRKMNMSINISSDEMRQMNNRRFECLPESNCEVTLDIKSAEEMARKNECNEVDVINGDGNHGNTETRIRNGMMSMTNIGNMEKINFMKRLYLDHVIGCDGLEHAMFGSRFDVRKLGRMDIPTLQARGDGYDHGLPDQRTKAVLAESLCELSAPIAIVKLRSCDQRCRENSNCEVTLDIKSAEEMARKNECDKVDVIKGDGNRGNTEMRMRNGMMSMTNIGINRWQNRTTRPIHLRTEVNRKSGPIMIGNMGKINFMKRLYLDHVIGCDGLEHAMFGSRFDVQKLGRMDIPTLRARGCL